MATALVGASSMLGDKEEEAESSVPSGSPLVGVALTMGGVAMTALQCRAGSQAWPAPPVPDPGGPRRASTPGSAA